MNIKEMTDQELQETFMELWESIERVECYGTRDLLLREALGQELENRGYEICEESTISFRKDDEHD